MKIGWHGSARIWLFSVPGVFGYLQQPLSQTGPPFLVSSQEGGVCSSSKWGWERIRVLTSQTAFTVPLESPLSFLRLHYFLSTLSSLQLLSCPLSSLRLSFFSISLCPPWDYPFLYKQLSQRFTLSPQAQLATLATKLL